MEQVNLDLRRERESASFNSEDFALWWAGGREQLEERRQLERYFFEDPEFVDAVHPSFLSYKERYEHALAKSTKFLTKLREWQRTHSKDEQTQQSQQNDQLNLKTLHDFRLLLTGPLGTALFQQSFPLRLHFSMFLPTLLNQATEEQQRRWLGRAWRMDGIVGTYAQTELGHGSYIRGLETRADYDKQTEEFVLNSPTLTAYKWWPGGLGQTANMVVVLAQLYINGKHHGLQQFLVRIRDEHTHEPLPGVDVGDIGAKVGANSVNNGFLGFRNVRIPRDQMLMKNAQVLANGEFVEAAQPLLVYGTMVFVRVMIVRDVMFGLLQAATIATRYAAVRHQSPIDPKAAEPQILDHLTQQAKILPQIARGICYRLAADGIWSFYQRVMQQLTTEQGKKSSGALELAELHALSCSLKSVCTQDAAEGIDVLRKSCGGHGYLASANFDSILGLANAAVTYEGEYTVLLLQTARYLMRQYAAALRRRVLPESVKYLRETSRPNWNGNLLESAARALEISATEQLREAYEWQQHQLKNGAPMAAEQATNLTGRRLIAAASLHGHAYLVRNSINQLNQVLSKGNLKPELIQLLQQLVELFVLDTLLRQLGAVLRWNSINSKQLQQVEQRYEQLLTALRPNAVAVVDGFDFHDRALESTLGSYDGRVYERLMEHARKNPLNQQPVNPSYYTHLQPMMKAKL